MRKLKYGLIVLVLVAALVLGLSAWGCHGHVIRKPFAPNHGRDFDFTRPPCEPAVRPDAGDGDVLVRYLGAGGVYVEWKGVAVLTAPYFSNHGLLGAAFGRAGWDEEAIRRGLEGVPLDRVGAVLVGHSHYDHIGDLPPILDRLDPEARVLVNRTGWNILSACDGAGRLVDVESFEDGDGDGLPWVRFSRDGEALPVRVLPLSSGHAPHLKFFHYAEGEVDEPWRSCRWTERRLRAMKEGRTFAFIIDLMSEDLEEVEFRIHFQDAASEPPQGFPPESLIEQERAADLAIVCMPSSWLVDGYPERILERLSARHAMVIHYEDFFRSADKPVRFAPGLTNRRANSFMDRVENEMTRIGERRHGELAPFSGPAPRTCGPCGDLWTMPLPGEWLRFRKRGHSSFSRVTITGNPTTGEEAG